MEEQTPPVMNDTTPGELEMAQVPIPTSDPSTTVTSTIETSSSDLSKQKNSIFFKLPVEIRLAIYCDLLARAVYLTGPMSPSTDNSSEQAQQEARLDLPARHPAILRTCHAIFAEAIPTLYRENVCAIRARSAINKQAPRFSVNGIDSDDKLTHLDQMLRYGHYIRIFHVNIDFHGAWENDYRHKVDCVFDFLSQMPQIDYLRVCLSGHAPGINLMDPRPVQSLFTTTLMREQGFIQRMARRFVECVLGRLRNIKQACVAEVTHFRSNLAAYELAHTDPDDSWAEDLAKRMMSPEYDGENITSTLLDRYEIFKGILFRENSILARASARRKLLKAWRKTLGFLSKQENESMDRYISYEDRALGACYRQSITLKELGREALLRLLEEGDTGPIPEYIQLAITGMGLGPYRPHIKRRKRSFTYGK